MFSVLIGIALIIVGVLTWLAALSVAQALAIFIGLVGVLVLLYGFGSRVKYARF